MSGAADLASLDAALTAILSPQAEIRREGEAQAQSMIMQAGKDLAQSLGNCIALCVFANAFLAFGRVLALLVCRTGGMSLFLEYLNHSGPAAHLRQLAGVLLKRHVAAAWDQLDGDTKQALLQTASAMLDAAERPIQNTAVRSGSSAIERRDC